MQVSANGIFVHVDYVMAAINNYKKVPLIYSCFDRSEISMRGFTANIGLSEVSLYPEDGNSSIIMMPKAEMKSYHTKLMRGREPVNHGVCVSIYFNQTYVLTTKKKQQTDIYNWLMNTYNLPLLKEWVPYLLKEGEEQLLETKMEFYGRIPQEMEDMILYEVSLSETALREMVSNGLKSRKIQIAKEEQKLLQFESMDEYFLKYGNTLSENLEKKLNPLVPLKDYVELEFYSSKNGNPL